jgi:hypothetical protein
VDRDLCFDGQRLNDDVQQAIGTKVKNESASRAEQAK